MKTTLYTTNAVLYLSSTKLRAMLAMLEWLGWKEPEVVVGVPELARITKGRFNPSSDFVLVMSNGAHVRNPIELANWVEQQGLVPM